jgi:hypothetical protein
MKRLIIIGVIVIIFIYFLFSYEPYESPRTPYTPRMIHLIYLPWDSSQKLKDDPYDFDHSSYTELKDAHPTYQVKLWTLPECKEFVKKYYPAYEKAIFNVSRPTMIVDILRLLFVYHYGGIYWQYGSTALVDMDQFLPTKNVKLFTEAILTDEMANEMRKEPIRNGEPEERVRVCNQIFSAIPRHPYLFELFEKTIKNVQTYPIRRDYDILYTTANAMMSAMYDKVGKFRDDIELVDLEKSKKMIYIKSNGSWRLVKLT